jgi:hypothetical protein
LRFTGQATDRFRCKPVAFSPFSGPGCLKPGCPSSRISVGSLAAVLVDFATSSLRQFLSRPVQ